MALDPRREGDRYDTLARNLAARPQTGDTQARLAKLLAERDRWYALADREDARIARWTSGQAAAQKLYDVAPAVPVQAAAMTPSAGPTEAAASSTSGYVLAAVAILGTALVWRARG